MVGEYYVEDGVYQADIYCYELMPDTHYYYRAFVFYRDEYTNEYVFFYGDILSFSTPDMPFVLEINTYEPDYYGGSYMYAYGGGYCTKPLLINQLGFCYSKTNAYPQYDSDLHTWVATPTGDDMYFDFSSVISYLKSTTTVTGRLCEQTTPTPFCTLEYTCTGSVNKASRSAA